MNNSFREAPLFGSSRHFLRTRRPAQRSGPQVGDGPEVHARCHRVRLGQARQHSLVVRICSGPLITFRNVFAVF